MLRTLAIANYRSLRELLIPLGQLTLVTGPNGSGKSSVYRALRLLADTAHGGVIRSLAREGGLTSVLWAGPEQFSAAVRRGEHRVEGTRRTRPVSLRLGFAGDAASDFGYAIDVGLPPPVPATVFSLHRAGQAAGRDPHRQPRRGRGPALAVAGALRRGP